MKSTITCRKRSELPTSLTEVIIIIVIVIIVAIYAPYVDQTQNANEFINSVKRSKSKMIEILRKKSTLLATIKLVQEEIDEQNLFVKLGLINKGKYRLHPKFENYTITNVSRRCSVFFERK